MMRRSAPQHPRSRVMLLAFRGYQNSLAPQDMWTTRRSGTRRQKCLKTTIIADYRLLVEADRRRHDPRRPVLFRSHVV